MHFSQINKEHILNERESVCVSEKESLRSSSKKCLERILIVTVPISPKRMPDQNLSIRVLIQNLLKDRSQLSLSDQHPPNSEIIDQDVVPRTLKQLRDAPGDEELLFCSCCHDSDCYEATQHTLSLTTRRGSDPQGFL